MSISFDLTLQSDFVQGHGEPFTYYRASLCPCGIGPYSTDPNRPLLNCTACNATGFIYAAPIQQIGIMTAMRNLKDVAAFGELFPGDMVLGMGPDPLVVLNDWDLIRPFFPVGFNGQVNKRGSGVTDPLDYPISQLFSVQSINLANNYQIITYTEGTDFTLSNRTITWIQTTKVQTYLPPSVSYSITANVIFDYIVVSSAMERWDNYADNLGQRMLVRKRHLVMPQAAI